VRTSGPLVVTGLEVRYGDLVAVRGVSFELLPSQTLAVTGPAGAGKSSLLWALAGATAYTGDVVLDGGPVTDRTSAAARGVKVVPQGNGLAAVLTAEENVLVSLVVAGVPVDEARRRTVEALGAVGLEESGRHLVEELSGGQQQRVAVARALAGRAGLLLADEPTSDIDSGTRERVVAALLAQAAAGAIVVVATHDPETAAALDGELGLDDGVPTWVRQLP
jgi:putative ABC transport system ATP-binding protein